MADPKVLPDISLLGEAQTKELCKLLCSCLIVARRQRFGDESASPERLLRYSSDAARLASIALAAGEALLESIERDAGKQPELDPVLDAIPDYSTTTEEAIEALCDRLWASLASAKGQHFRDRPASKIPSPWWFAHYSRDAIRLARIALHAAEEFQGAAKAQAEGN